MGCGFNMSNAIKNMYSTSMCSIISNGKIGDEFEVKKGVKQGFCSSDILFNCYINKIIKTLKMNLPNESILENLHCLFHADDGALLSEIRQLFINKINKITQCFTELDQQIHLGKTKFMVINGEKIDKIPIVLNSGTIKYTQKQNYLGAIISDSGNISQDIRLQMKKIGPRMNIK